MIIPHYISIKEKKYFLRVVYFKHGKLELSYSGLCSIHENLEERAISISLITGGDI